MVVFEIAPEHVLDAIGAVEHTDAQSALDLVETVEEHLGTLVVCLVALLQKRLVIEHAAVQPPGILGQTEGRIGTTGPGQIGCIGRGMRNRQRGILGIDLHRRNVQLRRLTATQQQELADPADLDADGRSERNVDPG